MERLPPREIPPRILRQLQEVGRDLYVLALVTSHGGNLSVRDGDGAWITGTGTMLGRLQAATSATSTPTAATKARRLRAIPSSTTPSTPSAMPAPSSTPTHGTRSRSPSRSTPSRRPTSKGSSTSRPCPSSRPGRGRSNRSRRPSSPTASSSSAATAPTHAGATPGRRSTGRPPSKRAPTSRSSAARSADRPVGGRCRPAGPYTHPRARWTFDWLTLAQWLAILRIGVGLWWLESVRHKDLRDFLGGGSMGWVDSLTRDHPFPPFARMVRRLSLATGRRRVVTSWLIVLGEFAVGVSLIFGILTPLGLAVAIFLNANYFLLAGLPGDYGEQGQNLMMILIEVVCLATGAWREWSIDAWT